MAAYFTPATLQFLAQLKRNNRREWFLKNKPRYEAEARDPALRFVAEVAARLQEISPHLAADPRPIGGSLFRIYRDTRFSADKKPYKTHLGMHFSHAKGRDKVHVPGYYLHIEPGQSFMAAGVWHPDAPTLLKLRNAIAADPERWTRAHKGYELEGDRLSRPPRGFSPTHPLIEDLKLKDFIVSTALADKQVCAPSFMTLFTREARKMAPLVGFLAVALGLKF